MILMSVPIHGFSSLKLSEVKLSAMAFIIRSRGEKGKNPTPKDVSLDNNFCCSCKSNKPLGSNQNFLVPSTIGVSSVLPGELLKIPGLPLHMKMRKSLNKESGNLGSNPKWHPNTKKDDLTLFKSLP